MKKQYHQKKITSQVKLAQACTSLGMFFRLSIRNPKDYMHIRLGNRQIINTGVKRETHLFRNEFTSLDPTDCHVDTLIGDQSIFDEEVQALESDDLGGAMESLQDVTSMESVSEETSKHKNRIKLSQVHQKLGKRGFHKVRF